MSSTRTSDPLRPLERVAATLSGLLFAAFVLVLLLTVLGLAVGGGTPFSDGVCVAVDPASVATSPGGFPAVAVDGVARTVDTVRVCDADPGVGVSVLSFALRYGAVVLFASWLWLIGRAVRQARRGGLFGEATVRAVRLLAWAVILGSALGAVARAAGSVALDVLVAGARDVTGGFLGHLDVPWGGLVAGAGILTVARVLRVGDRMRRDLDGLV